LDWIGRSNTGTGAEPQVGKKEKDQGKRIKRGIQQTEEGEKERLSAYLDILSGWIPRKEAGPWTRVEGKAKGRKMRGSSIQICRRKRSKRKVKDVQPRTSKKKTSTDEKGRWGGVFQLTRRILLHEEGEIATIWGGKGTMESRDLERNRKKNARGAAKEKEK